MNWLFVALTAAAAPPDVYQTTVEIMPKGKLESSMSMILQESKTGMIRSEASGGGSSALEMSIEPDFEGLLAKIKLDFKRADGLEFSAQAVPTKIKLGETQEIYINGLEPVTIKLRVTKH